MTTAPAKKLRVVFDTNVCFSAFTHPPGPPYRIWRKAVDRSFILLASPAILREIGGFLRDVLRWQEAETIGTRSGVGRRSAASSRRTFCTSGAFALSASNLWLFTIGPPAMDLEELRTAGIHVMGLELTCGDDDGDK